MTPTTKLLEQFGKPLLLREGAELTDGQLLEWFIEHQDEAAFATLVRRHGPMVWAVSRRLLDYHDAEDAFQAVFLVLLRKATAIVPREMVANWLYGVAHHAALHARRTAARRRLRERQVTEMPDLQAAPQGLWHDLQPLLDQELSRLPDKYRVVVVLCDLEGKTRKEAARQLGVPEGTVAGRLARARTMLAKHLARQGLTLSGGAMAAMLSQSAVSACVPAAVVWGTIKTARLVAAAQAVSGGAVSAKVAALTDGALKTMFLSKLMTVTSVLLVVLLGGGLTLGLAQGLKRTAASSPASSSEVDAPAKADRVPKPKTDPELLQGVWQVEEAAANGMHLKQEEDTKQVWHIAGNKIIIKYPDGSTEELAYRLDSTKKPKTIDLVPDAAGKGEALPGIYALDGNSLRLCYTKGKTAQGKTAPRPTTFEQALEFSKDRGRRLFVLRRAPATKGGDKPKPAGEQGRLERQPPDRAPAITGLGPGALPGKNKKRPDKALSAEEEFKALVKEFDAGSQDVMRRDGYEKRALQLAQMSPEEPFVVDALLWILKRGWQPNGGVLLATTMPFGQSASKALELLARDHAEDKRAAEMAGLLLLAPVEADQFLRALMEKSSDRNVQAGACCALASRAKWRAEEARFNSTLLRPAAAGEERKQFERRKKKFEVDEEQLYKEAEKYFELAARKYGDVSYCDKLTLGAIAASALFEVRHLRIGMTAPEIEGEDVSGKKLELRDYRGKVVLLDFYWWGNAPSETIHPFERSLMKTFADRPFTILGINRDQDRKALARMREDQKITWPSWFDVSGPTAGRWLDGGTPPGPIASRWNTRCWPTLYLLDHKGVIRDKSIGLKDMEKRLEQLVHEAEAAAK